MIALALRLVGFLLLFVGVMLFILGANPGGSCYGSNTACGPGNTGWQSGQANLVLTGKLIAAVGLFVVAMGIGIKVHFGLAAPTSGRPEEWQFVANDRRANYLLLVIVTVLLVILLWTPVFTGVAAG